MDTKIMDLDFARPYFGDEEREAVRSVMAGHWLANGPRVEEFESRFASLVGVSYALAVNSGSSANLLALACLDLPKGSKVLTSGCGFPATLSPILHLGLEPVLVDYDKTFNADMGQVREKVKGCSAAILAHTMGNPVDLSGLEGIPVIEDCCEALGARIHGRQVGSSGLGTFSFYPSHQITALGGGGMVTFTDEAQYLRAKSMRDWGKSQFHGGYGRTNTSYSCEVDGIDYFPHYSYETVGWNFKLPEANAAFGTEQLNRLEEIVLERLTNHEALVEGLPETIETAISVSGADPSWFGVILCPKHYSGHVLGDELERMGVRHRPFFAGNITRHKAFSHLRQDLPYADYLMRNAIFIGCYAGMTGIQVQYVKEAIKECHHNALCSV